jgi:Uri superfamily endonuclease
VKQAEIYSESCCLHDIKTSSQYDVLLMNVKERNHTTDAKRLPSLSGTYSLLLISHAEKDLQVGSLGRMKLLPGFYLYVGSAFGPGGLRARVTRHVGVEKKLRWHIDYLRAVTELAGVWHTQDPKRQECNWAEALATMTAATVPFPGFGASDCTCCSHLLFFPVEPSLVAFRRKVHKCVPGHARISWQAADDLVKG